MLPGRLARRGAGRGLLWHEDTDSLWDDEHNTLRLADGQGVRSEGNLRPHPSRGAQVLGAYGEDFYQGEAALTVNQYGKGRAYYIASFGEDALYRDLYQKLAGELSLKRALEDLPPEGVEACLRENGEAQYLFLQTFRPAAAGFPAPGYAPLSRQPCAREPPWPPMTARCFAGKRVTARIFPGKHKTE